MGSFTLDIKWIEASSPLNWICQLKLGVQLSWALIDQVYGKGHVPQEPLVGLSSIGRVAH
jgi:hypothetical protein